MQSRTTVKARRDAAYYRVTVAPRKAEQDKRARGPLILTFTDKGEADEFHTRCLVAGYETDFDTYKLFRSADEASDELAFWFN